MESVGTDGDRGISMVVRAAGSVDLVLRLRRLGFLFMPGMTGLMKDDDGEEGSDVTDEESELKGAWIESPFMFLGRRGAGEVMGRSNVVGSETVSPAMPDRPAKDGGAKLESGMMFTGESGDDEGDGSERSDESAHDTVVVGDDSADSVVWVEVLLWCLCEASKGSVDGRSSVCELSGDFAGSISITSFGSIRVTRPDWSMLSLSTPYTDMNEGI